MPLLIDSYNVLHTAGVLPPELAGIDVLGLIGLLEKSRYHDKKATLVCDGMPQPGKGLRPVTRLGQVAIRYSGHGKPADDLIGQLISASTAPRRLIVVSSDHAVQRVARRRRCKVLTSENFLQQLADDVHASQSAKVKPGAKPIAGGLSEQQIDQWVNLFKVDQKTLAIPPGVKPPRTPEADSGTSAAIGQDDSSTPIPPAAAERGEQPLPQLPTGEAGQEILEDLIEQAERLWKQENPSSAKSKEDEEETSG